MTDTDELADLRAQLKRLERRQALAAGEAARSERLLLARLLIVVATVALFLAVSMGWYTDIDVAGESVDSVSGWRVFTLMAGDEEGALAFAGGYSWIVVFATLAGGASVFVLGRRWVAIVLSTLLALLAAGQLLVNTQADDGEQLAGVWCAIIVMAGGSFAWGNLVAPLRDAQAYEVGRKYVRE